MHFGSGPMMAAPDTFKIVIHGKGGHAAMPHQAVDPILAAGQVITMIQQVVSRNLSPFSQAVIGISSIHGGAADNVIPNEVVMTGTVRSLDPAVRAEVPGRMEEVIAGVCKAVRATYTFTYEHGYPAVVNHEADTQTAFQVARALHGAEKIGQLEPTMGGEDFAYYLEVVPGTFGTLGARPQGGSQPSGLHTSTLILDEGAIPVGVAYYLGLIQHYLVK
jgi:amidohydrolase